MFVMKRTLFFRISSFIGGCLPVTVFEVVSGKVSSRLVFLSGHDGVVEVVVPLPRGVGNKGGRIGGVLK